MRNKTMIGIGLILVITFGYLGYITFNPNRKVNTNVGSLKKEIKSLKDSTNISLDEITPFNWDTMYTFKPYTSKDDIYKVIGYKWKGINEGVGDNMNQIVFLKEGKVVCYLYGYPQNLGYSFVFEEYNGNHMELKRNLNPNFNVKLENDMVVLTYSKSKQ